MRRTPQQQPSKGHEDGWQKSSEGLRDCVFVRKLETRVREGDQVGLYKHLKTMNLEGKRDRSPAYIKDEDGIFLRDVEFVRERWARWFHTHLNAMPPKLDPNIAEGLDQ